MDTISKFKRRLGLLTSSSQFRYALTYILITSVVLVFLNFYSASNTRSLMFKTKAASMQGKAQVIASSLGGLETLSTENVAQVISLLGDLDVTRVLVTNAEGRALYDSLARDNATGKVVLLSEVSKALEGNDVIFCSYSTGALESRACMPIMYYGNPIGAIYLMEYDTDQGAIIAALELNIARISIILGVVVTLFSVVFSLTFSRRMRMIMHSIQLLREGEYSQPINLRGNDEVGILAREFNKLTERLEASEKAQRQFVSDASHELKTPLASIKLLSDTILQNRMDLATIREFVGDIGNEADRLTRMAQKLLELGRGDDAKKEEFLVIETGYVVEKVLRMLTPGAQLRQISIETKMELGCTVVTREDDFYQIVFNLVENGIKYNSDKGTLTVSLKREEDDVVLRVEDTGCGIPEDSLPYIFDRFYRVDKARSRQAGGSGLGLSIVHDLVELNYGKVFVESEVGKGTRFTVVFPFFGTEEDT